jgi:crotonobetainyl-CoA hydratase
MSEAVAFRKEGRIGFMTIDRPRVMNALGPAANAAMLEHWCTARDDDDIWAVVLSATGDRAFCAGADMSDQLVGDPGRARIGFGGGLTGLGGPRLVFNKPVIAAVNGYALGGGFELALACDIIVASSTAVFGMPEVKIGIIAESPPVHRAIRQLPHHVALELLMTGRAMGAQEACGWGIVHQVVSPDLLAATAAEVAKTVVSSSPLALQAVKSAVLSRADDPLDTALESRFELVEAYMRSDDYREALSAVADKRRPNWTGR